MPAKSNSKFKFSTPPRDYCGSARGLPAFDHAAFVEALKSNPGEWAKVPGISGKTARSWSWGVKNGKPKSFEPAGSFEAVSRMLEDGTVGVWVRYVGKKTTTRRRK